MKPKLRTIIKFINTVSSLLNKPSDIPLELIVAVARRAAQHDNGRFNKSVTVLV